MTSELLFTVPMWAEMCCWTLIQLLRKYSLCIYSTRNILKRNVYHSHETNTKECHKYCLVTNHLQSSTFFLLLQSSVFLIESVSIGKLTLSQTAYWYTPAFLLQGSTHTNTRTHTQSITSLWVVARVNGGPSPFFRPSTSLWKYINTYTFFNLCSQMDMVRFRVNYEILKRITDVCFVFFQYEDFKGERIKSISVKRVPSLSHTQTYSKLNNTINYNA